MFRRNENIHASLRTWDCSVIVSRPKYTSILLLLIGVVGLSTVNTVKGPLQALQSESGNYSVSWEITNENPPEIVFDVVASTVGWVGIGVSPTGLMDGADLCIVAVDDGGRFYSGDYHGVGNIPVRDRNGGMDWYLAASITENGTHTFVKFKRRLFTNDEDDIEITDSETFLMWSYGRDDNVTQKHQERGAFVVNLLEQKQA